MNESDSLLTGDTVDQIVSAYPFYCRPSPPPTVPTAPLYRCGVCDRPVELIPGRAVWRHADGANTTHTIWPKEPTALGYMIDELGSIARARTLVDQPKQPMRIVLDELQELDLARNRDIVAIPLDAGPGPCVICAKEITTYESYGVYPGGRMHWNCLRAESDAVSPPRKEPPKWMGAVYALNILGVFGWIALFLFRR